MTIRIGINGFGRIGRQVARFAADGQSDIELVAINTSTSDAKLLAHLLRYDSVHGRFSGTVAADGDRLVVGDSEIRVTAEPEPSRIPWGESGVDVVVESSGRFTTGAEARGHLDAGARRVLITAPAEGEDLTIVFGANESRFDPDRHRIISGASCTTCCLAPVAKVLDNAFGIAGGFMTTVHAYTRDQELIDGSHDDYRRARSAALNIVPTKTGAATMLGKVLPQLDGKLGAMAVRVPTADVSLLMLSVSLSHPSPASEVNEVFIEAARRADLQGVLGVTDEPLVSTDFVGDARSAIVDLGATSTEPGAHAQVLAWYDNEYGYAARMLDLVRLLGAAEKAEAVPALATT